MNDCKNLINCTFFNCCEEYKKENSVQGFITMYCRGNKQVDCVRLKLSSSFGKGVVPKNMMPNGYPLPGTTKDEWSDEAKKPSKYL